MKMVETNGNILYSDYGHEEIARTITLTFEREGEDHPDSGRKAFPLLLRQLADLYEQQGGDPPAVIVVGFGEIEDKAPNGEEIDTGQSQCRLVCFSEVETFYAVPPNTIWANQPNTIGSLTWEDDDE